MARTVSTSTAKATNEKEQAQSVSIEDIENYKAEIEAMRKENMELLNQFKELANQFKAITETQKSISEPTPAPVRPVMKHTQEHTPPEMGRQVRIMSLCYGPLILHDGRGYSIKLDKYGDIKPVLYSTLTDIVNEERRFAEKGYFYILDGDAVHFLGLDYVYETLLSKDIIDNILTYNDVDIKGFIGTANDSQKKLIIRNICDKIYNEGVDSVDMNKVELINRLCECSIMDMVNEMKEYARD